MKVMGLVLALALGSCSTVGGEDPAIIAKKSLTAAHALHDVFALSASAAAKSNACVGMCAVRAKDYLDRSAALLKAADGLSDPNDIAKDVSAAVAILDQAKALGL